MTTQLTRQEQLNVLYSAARLLDVGNPQAAHLELMSAIPDTPAESDCFPAMVGAANWIVPLDHPKMALRKLAEALLVLERGERGAI